MNAAKGVPEDPYQEQSQDRVRPVQYKRENQQWVAELTGDYGLDIQRRAHEDLANYLHVVAYNYIEKRRNNTSKLTVYSNEEITCLAQDSVQNLLERFAKNNFALLGKYSERGSFTSWAAQVLCNQIASELRKPAWRRQELLSESQEQKTPSADQSMPERAAIQSYVHEVIESCLQQLPERHQAALVRCVIEGEPATAVAEELDTTPNAVYMLVHRAKREMRKQLTSAGLDVNFLA